MIISPFIKYSFIKPNSSYRVHCAYFISNIIRKNRLIIYIEIDKDICTVAGYAQLITTKLNSFIRVTHPLIQEVSCYGTWCRFLNPPRGVLPFRSWIIRPLQSPGSELHSITPYYIQKYSVIIPFHLTHV